jgi:hypothetical protein
VFLSLADLQISILTGYYGDQSIATAEQGGEAGYYDADGNYVYYDYDNSQYDATQYDASQEYQY